MFFIFSQCYISTVIIKQHIHHMARKNMESPPKLSISNCSSLFAASEDIYCLTISF